MSNSMGQDRLSSLALIHLEKELANDIDIKIVIDQFGSHSSGKRFYFNGFKIKLSIGLLICFYFHFYVIYKKKIFIS